MAATKDSEERKRKKKAEKKQTRVILQIQLPKGIPFNRQQTTITVTLFLGFITSSPNLARPHEAELYSNPANSYNAALYVSLT